MKKLSLVLLAAFLLAACGTEQVEQKENAVNGSTGEAPTEETAVETPEATEETVEEETPEATEETAPEAEEATAAAEPVGLQAYMPAEGLVKKFKVDSFELTRKVLEVKDNKVLEEITFGDVKTVQITEWSENEMQMIFESAELQGVSDISIDALAPTSEPISMIDETDKTNGGWTVISNTETLELPAGTFENVVVIEQVLATETSAQTTTFTNYYAPELGFVKEKTVIVNGEDEQVSEIDLVSYE